MKLRTIRLKNLNSLRGDTFVDLDAPPLNDTGLFAITGPTGAGKTTLLDAITLALYGSMHRNKKAEEGMSHGTGECLAAVEFEAGGQRYLAQWALHRAYRRPDGKLQAPVRQVSRWNPETEAYDIIAEKVSEADAAIEEITGLDYGRFTRSVLLAQGDFASFLDASAKNRSALLEQITGTGQYTRISQMAYQRHKKEQSALEQLMQRQGDIQLLNREERGGFEAQQQQIRQELEALETESDRLASLLQWWERREALAQRLESEQAALQQIDEDRQAAASELHQLERHRLTRPFREDLLAYDQTSRRLQDQQIEQQAGKAALREIEQQQEASQQRLVDKEQELETLEKEWSELDRILYQVVPLDVSLREKAADLDRLAEDRREQQQKLEQASAEIKSLQQQLQERETARQHLLKQLDEQPVDGAFSDRLGRLEALAQRRQQELGRHAALQDQHQKLTNRIASLEANQKTLEQTLGREEKQLAQLEHAFDQALPPDYTTDRPASLERLQARLLEMGDMRAAVQQLDAALHAYRTLLQEEQAVLEALDTLQAREFALNKDLLNHQDQLLQLEEELAFDRKVYQQQLKIANYAKDRQDLRDGDPCPLCRSTHHPFREHPVEPYVDEAEQKLRRREQARDRKMAQYQQAQRRAAEVFQEIAHLRGKRDDEVGGKLGDLRDDLADKEQAISQLLATLRPDTLPAQSPEAFSAWKNQWEAEREALLRRQQTLLDIQRRLLDKQEAVQHLRRDLHEKSSALNLKRQEAKSCRERLRVHVEDAEQAERDMQQIFDQLGMPFERDAVEANLRSLRSRRDRIEAQQKKVQTLNDQQLATREKLEARQRAIVDHQHALTNLDRRIKVQSEAQEALLRQRQDLFGDREPESARQSAKARLAACRQALKERRQQADALNKQVDQRSHQLQHLDTHIRQDRESLQQLERKLEPQLAASGLGGLDVARQALLPPSEEQRLEERKQALDQREAIHRSRLAEATKGLEELERHQPTEESAELLRGKWQALRAKIQAQNQELGRIRQILLQDEAFRERAEALSRAIDAQRAETQRWGRLNDLIGSADGKKFRVFAQGLTLRTLVRLANQHLHQLNDRYRIRRRAGEELELDIVDTYQADNIRSMQTLSGGERFLVSLALALGLSDLSGHRHNIRSLFIDEGFGTLDKETLDLALATLENLRASGKTIGIISHVEELKERIGVQIQVRRLGNGLSAIHIIGS